VPDYSQPLEARTIEDYVDHFAGTLGSQDWLKGVILLFDSVEELSSEMAEWLVQGLMIRVFDDLEGVGFSGAGCQFRVIFVGRYVTSNWKNLAHGKIALSILPLTPFHLDAISETVRRAARAVHMRLSEQHIHSISYYIMRLTGGHPGCIAAILTELAGKRFAGWKPYFDRKGQKRIYDEVVGGVIQEVKQSIPSDLRPVFKTLSIFRRFNYDMLLYLIDKGEIVEWSAGTADDDLAWSLLRAITATHLIERRESFYAHDIIRRLLAIEMRQEEPDRYRRLCEHAENFYRATLENRNPKNPHLWFIEAAYQQLQRYAIERYTSPEQFLQELIDGLRGYLDRAENHADRQERLADLKQALAADWEWEYLATDVLDPDGFQNILSQLEQSSSAELEG
jgi:hypothetical protein